MTEESDKNEKDDDVDDEVDLDVNQGIGSSYSTPDETTTADPGWGEENSTDKTDSPAQDEDTTPEIASDSARESEPTTELEDQTGQSPAHTDGDSAADQKQPQTFVESPATGGSNPLTVRELNQTMRARVDQSFFADTVVPHTGPKLPYTLRRVGNEVQNYERPRELKLKLSTQSHNQLTRAMDHLNDSIYPNTNVHQVDVLEAALLVGLWNLDRTVNVLDAWGLDQIDKQ
jgi:hypothetical protein